MPRIDVGHITLNYEERGSGPALLFIPGLVGLLNAWEFQMAHFSRRYRCIAFDHRGTRDDATVPFYQSEDLHRAAAGSKLVIVEDGGHYSYRRHWQQWNAIAETFLHEHEEQA
jgi:pimeloyl-ACP methyl ester carboxylesterase